MRYLSDNRLKRDPQNKPMSIGSAFDAYVKSHLYELLFGKNHNPDYSFETLFEKQVESQNRTWAKKHGAYAFICYKNSGALADLIKLLENAVGQPRFEIEIRDDIGVGMEVLGKPDLFFINKDGYHVVLDWKVNGWCSNNAISPYPGYVKLQPSGKMHKDCVTMMYKGMVINGLNFLEHVDEKWALQLATYGWLCGAEVGEEFIVGIDQLVCKPLGLEFPDVRIAEHRTRISRQFQLQSFQKFVDVAAAINDNHIFKDMDIDQSRHRCDVLDKKVTTLGTDDIWGEIARDAQWI